MGVMSLVRVVGCAGAMVLRARVVLLEESTE
jgi:hypothetical protein